MATKNGELQTEVVAVSPELAAKWLETMRVNRKLTVGLVDRYKESMVGGFWNLDASPIRFNTQGQLIDGQHRLWAVIESGTTQDFLVVRNVPDEAFLTMDSGKKRSFSDVLSIEYPDMPNELQVAAATRIIYRFENGHSLSSVATGQGRDIPNSVLLEFFQERKDDIVAASRMADSVYSSFPRMIPASKLALLAWMFQGLDLDDSNEFFQRLKDGKNLADGSPILELRRIYGNELLRKTRSNFELMALAIKAWNLYRQGMTVQTLLLKLGGAHPEPVPVAH